MYIDTHCHISKDDYENIDKVINDAKENDVNYLFICGWDKKSIKESIEISEKYDNVFLELGFHPSEANITSDEDLIELEKIVKNNKKVIAIGEIGLDYHWEKDNKKKQKELFRKQIELAKKLDLPVVIHSRDAFQDTYDILKETKYKGVIHCFSGNEENAKMYLSIGYYLGIGGVVTFKNSNLKNTLKNVPLERLLLETDSPYLAPTPHRGEQNEPKYIPLIASEIAEIKGLSKEEIGLITTENAKKIYCLNNFVKID
jgi:TatD DNase family protein